MKRLISLSILLVLATYIYYVTNLVVFVSFLLVASCGYFHNKLLKKHIRKANKNVIDFMCDSHRNFDAIIIGQPLTHESMMKIKGKNVLTFTHKKRTLFASYLFLIHQYSYLREDGQGVIYIVLSEKDTDKELYATIYDVCCFHPVIKKKLNVGVALKYPILFYYKKFRAKDFFVDNNDISIRERISRFCLERNLNIEFIYQ